MKYTYQYKGIERRDILVWCHMNISGRSYCSGPDTITFDDEAAYTWFLLRWS